MWCRRCGREGKVLPSVAGPSCKTSGPIPLPHFVQHGSTSYRGHGLPNQQHQLVKHLSLWGEIPIQRVARGDILAGDEVARANNFVKNNGNRRKSFELRVTLRKETSRQRRILPRTEFHSPMRAGASIISE